MRVALVALILLAACGQRRIDPRVRPPTRFDARVDLFRRFVAELPSCPSRGAPSVDEVLARGFRHGDAVVVQGHPAVRCLGAREVNPIEERGPPLQDYCEPTTNVVWVLERAAPAGTGKLSACAPIAIEMPGVILLYPRPRDLFTCDAEAAAVGAPGLTVTISGTGVFFPSRPSLAEPDRDREGVTFLDVERICRVDTGGT